MIDARAILDALPKPVAVIDPALTVLEANRAFTARFGMGRNGNESPSHALFWSGLGSLVGRLQPVAKTGVFRWRDETGDGRPFDVRLFRLDEHRLLLVADDVSPYERAQDIQTAVRDYVERVLNRLRVAVIVLDADFKVTLYNAAQSALWERVGQTTSPVEIIGTAISAAHPVLSAEDWAVASDAARDGRSVRYSGRRYESADVVVDVEVRPLHSAGEAPQGAICLTDVLPTAQRSGR